MAKDNVVTTVRPAVYPTGLMWLGGAVWLANQPGYNFWDGLIWVYYVGRYIAMHATAI